MSTQSKIEWTERTWNPTIGCTKISPGCKHCYAEVMARRLQAMGIRDRPIAARSPWQNTVAERLIGSMRRECVDHLIAFGETHLRRILEKYSDYYNGSRNHLSLAKDARVPRPIQHEGRMTRRPLLGGLHRQYARG